MYGKYFSSTFTGSMVGAGPEVFAVWGYIIANTIKGRIELNPALISAAIGMSTEKTEAAILYLESPDPKSRSKDLDGRRIIKEGEYQYFIPTHEHYRRITNHDELREYNRRKQAEHRAKSMSNSLSLTVIDKSSVSRQAEAEAEAEAEKEKSALSAPARPPRFVKPTPLEVAEYAKSRGINLDGEAFYSFYESNGWKVGRNSMKCWKSAVTGTWKSGTGNRTAGPAPTRKPYPGEVIKLLTELRAQKAAMWNRHSFNGEIPVEKQTLRQEYTELCRRVYELEKQARMV